MPEPSGAFEKVFEHSLDGVLLSRPDGTILRANGAACRSLGRSEEEIRRLGRGGLAVEDDSLRELLARRESAGSVAGEVHFRRPDGSTFPVEFTSGLIPSVGELPLAYVIFRDVTERHRTEDSLRRSNRALRMVTVCNEALVHVTTEKDLFIEICKAVVETGGYRMCWVGLAEHDARKTVRPVAHAGLEEGYLSATAVVWSDSPHGRGPTGTAIRTGKLVVGHDFSADPTLEPWREEALKRGYRSSTALPLVYDGQKIGAITAFSAELETFDDEELEILSQLAKDFAYGIHSLRQGAARLAAEESLRKSQALLKGITDTIPDPIFLKDREGRYVFANPAALEASGRSADQVLGKTDREIYADPAVGEAISEVDRRIMESGAPEVFEESLRLYGSPRVYLTTKAPLRDQNGDVIGVVGAARDITDRKRAEEALREREYVLTASQRVAHVGTWSWKVGDTKIYWSDEIYRIYGLNPDIGPPDFEFFFEIVHPEDRQKMREWAQAVVAGLDPPPVEFRVLRPDGGVRAIRTEGGVIETLGGVPARIAGTAHDVTERWQNEEALRESEKRYRELFEASPVPISVAEVISNTTGQPHDFRFLYVNAAFDRLMGMAATKLVGRTIVEVAPLVDRAMVDRACRVALTGVPDYFEGHSVGLDKDHETTVYSPSRGQIVTFVADVTERKRAEQVRREVHDRLAKIVATAPGIVCSFQMRPDGSACFPFGSERLAEHYGIPLARLAEDAAPFIALTHPDDLNGLLESIRESARRLVPFRREWRARHPTRGERWIDAHSVPVREPDGSTLWHGVASDVTDRKRAETERERLLMAIEQASETVVVTDTQGAIVYVNPAFEAVTGYTRAEVIGQNPRILKSGAHEDAVYQRLWGDISSGKTWHGRLVNRKKDGTTFTEDATISPIRDANGVITSYVAVTRDISSELAMERQLLQSQKMEGIGRLAGGVAHDFNNILSVILSCTEFALKDLREGDPLRDDIQEIEKAGKRAATLTRQLLAFSRRQVLQPEPLNLNKVLVEMEKMLRRILGEDIDLVQELALDLGIVKADPGQVEQVIMNLAVNARDAMPQGGKLTIETANAELDAEYAAQHEGSKPGPHVMLAVSDSGTGMGESTKAHLFEPFFTTKLPGKGTGLGLSTVYGIVKQSGGTIYVYSEPGKGTTFKIYLPREFSLQLVAKQLPTEARLGGTETILVVEDDGAVRAIARRILDGAGYTVLTAANGGEGLLLCEQHQAGIDLVLTDIVMPFMGGRVFVERLARIHPGIKVLYMSGYTDNAIVHHGVLDKGTRFIGKPLSHTELLRKIREALDE